MESQVVPSTHRVTDAKFHSLHAKMDVIKKGHARDSQRYKVDYESQSTDTQNFSSESKRETEYVRTFPLVGGGGARGEGNTPRESSCHKCQGSWFIGGHLLPSKPHFLFRVSWEVQAELH